MIARLRRADVPEEAAGGSSVLRGRDEGAQLLMGRLISFLESREGAQAPSAALIAEFEGTMPGGDSTLFKQVLKQVAVLKKRAGGTGVWTLRPEFR